MASPPKVNTFIIYQKDLVDPETKLKSLVGLYDNINVAGEPKFPFVLGEIRILIQFSSAFGEYNFQLDFSDVDRNQVLAEMPIPAVKYENKLAYNELKFKFSLRINNFGRYSFDLLESGVPLASKFINIQQAPKGVK